MQLSLWGYFWHGGGEAVEAAMRYRVKDTPQEATVISVSNTQGH